MPGRSRTLFATTFALGAALALFVACGKAGEGESCDIGSGNDDCDDGLVCRGSWEVASKEAVCCPRPPAKPSTGACEPKVMKFEPDPTVDASPIPPGTGGADSGGSGGTGGGVDGSAGAAGSPGVDGSADASGGTAGATADSGSD